MEKSNLGITIQFILGDISFSYFFFKDFQLRLVKNDKMYMTKRVTTPTTTTQQEDAELSALRVVSFTNGELLNELGLRLNGSEHLFVDALGRLIVVDELFGYVRIYENPCSGCRHKQDEIAVRKTSDVEKASLIVEKRFKFLHNQSSLRVTDDGKLYAVKERKIVQKFSFSLI